MTVTTATEPRAGNTRPRVSGSNRAARRRARQGRRQRLGCSRVLASSTRGLDMRPGALFLNNRYHDPTLGQFISVDPPVTLTGEAYIYAGGNPITNSDPSGLCWVRNDGNLWCGASNYNRYHDPTLGSFISVDPLVTMTGEAYIYAGGNPINGSDPSGLDCGMYWGCDASGNYDGGGRYVGAGALNAFDEFVARLWAIWVRSDRDFDGFIDDAARDVAATLTGRA